MNHTEGTEDLENLHCISTYLHDRNTCASIIGHGDYYRKLLCGQAKKSMKDATLVLTVYNSTIYFVSSAERRILTHE